MIVDFFFFFSFLYASSPRLSTSITELNKPESVGPVRASGSLLDIVCYVFQCRHCVFVLWKRTDLDRSHPTERRHRASAPKRRSRSEEYQVFPRMNPMFTDTRALHRR